MDNTKHMHKDVVITRNNDGELGELVQANDIEYLKAKNKIFKEFKVTKWEEIPIGKYNAVHSFIEIMFDFD